LPPREGEIERQASLAAAESDAQRLDKFLVYARFCKTRTVAAALIERGGVRVNRQPVGKAHLRLRPGDVLTLALPRGVVVVRVLGLALRREGAAQAQLLYEEIPAVSAPGGALPQAPAVE
jgi:ribosome-associated heat shock protein Hsp15